MSNNYKMKLPDMAYKCATQYKEVIKEIQDIYINNNSKHLAFLNIYPQLFFNKRNDENVILEIGVRNGEGTKSLVEVFPNSYIYCIEIGGLKRPPNCPAWTPEFEKNNILKKINNIKNNKGTPNVIIGDQADEGLLIKLGEEIKKKYGGFDIVIDDGGHTMHQQQTTLKILSNYMKENSLYFIEDTCTSYYPDYGGGSIGTKNTTIDLFKSIIDVLHRDYHNTRDKYNKVIPKNKQKKSNYSIVNNDHNIRSIEIYKEGCLIKYGYNLCYNYNENNQL